ncbi:MAG: hypothetical protein JW893_00995 [Candidatus Omnitrophica bacterium]|nr:hypothetical protein [Candidatus Omnitrophota bacterium]
MKSTLTRGLVLAAVLGLFCAQASANIVTGEVSEIQKDNQVLKIVPEDSETGSEESVSYDGETAFKGVASVDELEAGDVVTVIAQQDAKTKVLKAKTVTLSSM